MTWRASHPDSEKHPSLDDATRKRALRDSDEIVDLAEDTFHTDPDNPEFVEMAENFTLSFVVFVDEHELEESMELMDRIANCYDEDCEATKICKQLLEQYRPWRQFVADRNRKIINEIASNEEGKS